MSVSSLTVDMMFLPPVILNVSPMFTPVPVESSPTNVIPFESPAVAIFKNAEPVYTLSLPLVVSYHNSPVNGAVGAVPDAEFSRSFIMSSLLFSP